MDDKVQLPRKNRPKQSSPIPMRKENYGEPGTAEYHGSPTLSRRGSLWPQSFESQMDIKIYARSSSSRSALERDAEWARTRENRDDQGPAGSDVTEPLLKKASDAKSALPRESSFANEDLEGGQKRASSLYRGGSHESGPLAADEQRLSGQANIACETLHEEDDLCSESSFLQATFNGMNVLAGVGILSTPYALAQGGWLSMGFLVAFATICLYTGILLKRCLDSDSRIMSFPDIGQAAFGWAGRPLIGILLYFELYCVTVEYLILEGDNLASLFPFPGFTIVNFKFTQQQAYIVLSALIMLPTMCIRNLGLLSYISAGGVIASVAIVSNVGYVGAFDGVGFHHNGRLVDFNGLPVAVGVCAFCFCGHAVFPSIYKSMKHRKDFSKVLLVCFVLVTVLYAGIGVLGYTMFGSEVQSQVTLNLPQEYLSSRIAIWITLVNPFAKFALTLTPVAVALEELLPWTTKSRQYVLSSMAIRFGLVTSTVIVALVVPFFGYMMAFIGSFMSISVAIILPCLCYLKIFGRLGGVSSTEFSVLVVVLLIGVVAACTGTYSSIRGIIASFDNMTLLGVPHARF